MPYFTAGFDRLQRAFMHVKGKNWQEKIQRFSKLSQSSSNLEIQHEVKELCEELASQTKKLKDEQSWKLISQFLELLARLSTEVSLQFSEIQNIEDLQQRRRALLQFMTSPTLIYCLAEQIKHLFTHPHPLYNPEGTILENRLQKVLTAGMNSLCADIEVAINQSNYTPAGRVINRIFAIIFYLMDLLLMSFGLEPCFSIKGEGHHERQSIMPLKM